MKQGPLNKKFELTNDDDFPSTQDLHEDPGTNEFIDVLKRYKTNLPEFEHFKTDVEKFEQDLFIRNPDHNNYNIFHYLALVKIKDENKKQFADLFNEIFKKAIQQNKQGFLFERVDYARSNSSSTNLTTPEKKKAAVRPLDYAVINRKFYYVKLIINKIIFDNKDFKIENLCLTSKIYDSKDKPAIAAFTKNQKIANFIILNELLNSPEEFKNKLKEKPKELQDLVKTIFQEKLIEDHSNFNSVYNPTECSNFLIELINDASKSVHARAMSFLTALFNGNLEFSNMDSPNQQKTENSFPPKEYGDFTSFISEYFAAHETLKQNYHKLSSTNETLFAANENLTLQLTEMKKILEIQQKVWLTQEKELLQQQSILNQEKIALSETIQNKNKELAEANKTAADLQQQLIQKDQDHFEFLIKNKEHHQAQMVAKDEELENTKNTIAKLEKELKDKETNFRQTQMQNEAQYKMQIATKDKELEDSKREITDLTLRLENLQESYDSLNANMQDLETQKTALENKLQESNKSLTALQEDNNDKKRKIKELEEKKQTYKKKFKTTKEKVLSDFFSALSDSEQDEAENNPPQISHDDSEDDLPLGQLKKNSEIFKPNLAEQEFKLTITPQQAAHLYFNMYMLKKHGSKAVTAEIPFAFSPTQTFNKNVSNILGAWGEEFVYDFLYIKYESKHPEAEIKDKPYGFRIKYKVQSDSIYAIKIKVEFFNKGNYEKLINNQNPELAKGPYDFKITKTIYGECPSQKIKFIEAKATSKKKAYAFFTKNEHQFMKNNTDNCQVYRITHAGGTEVNCKPIKAQTILNEFEAGTSDYQLKINM